MRDEDNDKDDDEAWRTTSACAQGSDRTTRRSSLPSEGPAPSGPRPDLPGGTRAVASTAGFNRSDRSDRSDQSDPSDRLVGSDGTVGFSPSPIAFRPSLRASGWACGYGDFSDVLFILFIDVADSSCAPRPACVCLTWMNRMDRIACTLPVRAAGDAPSRSVSVFRLRGRDRDRERAIPSGGTRTVGSAADDTAVAEDGDPPVGMDRLDGSVGSVGLICRIRRIGRIDRSDRTDQSD
jgi:hypothetical protein